LIGDINDDDHDHVDNYSNDDDDVDNHDDHGHDDDDDVDDHDDNDHDDNYSKDEDHHSITPFLCRSSATNRIFCSCWDITLELW